ncbi:hypothetical protein [Rubrivirga marina]|uniref:Outer membrane protein beta-barrel domain-containing protein n=1 Tax=Rubrivirga marina TaxID=1196024 RepID=A0A271J307_9BACT|nr:hypothetical protein [Rubrivirga marina]PAP77833.1 hypothetical protein BSZ37_15980 [Rubrivirga marina]
MRRPILPVALAAFVLVVLTTGCSHYAVPPTLYAPSAPAVPLHDGPGEVSAAGRIGTGGAEGAVAASPLPHLGVFARASTLSRPGDGLGSMDQRRFEGGLTVYGPTSGVLRTEAGAGLAVGKVSGVGQAGYTRCAFRCASEPPPPEHYRASGALRQAFAHATVAARGDWMTVGLTGRLSRVAVSQIRTDEGARFPDATEVFAGLGMVSRIDAGPAGIEVAVGTSRPLGRTTVPDDGGPERTLDGRYRSVGGYASLGLTLAVDDLLWGRD